MTTTTPRRPELVIPQPSEEELAAGAGETEVITVPNTPASPLHPDLDALIDENNATMNRVHGFMVRTLDEIIETAQAHKLAIETAKNRAQSRTQTYIELAGAVLHSAKAMKSDLAKIEKLTEKDAK